MSFPNRPNPNRYSPYRRPNQNLWDLRPDQMSLAQRLELERNSATNQQSILGEIPIQSILPQPLPFQQRGFMLESPNLEQIPLQTTRYTPLSQSISTEAPDLEQIPLQEESPINTEDNQHLYQILDRAGIGMDDIHGKPWTGEGKSYDPDPSGKSFKDKEMLDFLRFTKDNPAAPSEEIRSRFNCLGQNCATNTVLGLSKLRARTEDNLSPRGEILRNSNPQGYIDLDEALGMGEKYRDQKNPNLTPKGTTTFFKNPDDHAGMPFDHVIFAEKEGTNSEPIYRSLNSGQKRSELQTLQQVLDQGKYTIPPYESIFSGKYRYFFK